MTEEVGEIGKGDYLIAFVCPWLSAAYRQAIDKASLGGVKRILFCQVLPQLRVSVCKSHTSVTVFYQFADFVQELYLSFVALINDNFSAGQG